MGLSHWGTLDPLTEILITPTSLTQEISVISSENNNMKPQCLYTVAVAWLLLEEVQTSMFSVSLGTFFFRETQMHS